MFLSTISNAHSPLGQPYLPFDSGQYPGDVRVVLRHEGFDGAALGAGVSVHVQRMDVHVGLRQDRVYDQVYALLHYYAEGGVCADPGKHLNVF